MKRIIKRVVLPLFLIALAVIIILSSRSNGQSPKADLRPVVLVPRETKPLLSSPDTSANSVSLVISQPKVKPEHAVIAFTFDDGDVSDYLLAYPILQKYGIKGTSYINPYNPDHNVKKKLSWDQIKQMYAYGWDFGDHTYTHMDMTKSTPDQIKQSVEKVNTAFTKNGLKIPQVFAYPYGKLNTAAIDAIKQYRKQARLAFYRSDFVNLNNVDPYEIPCVSADMQTEKRLEGKEKLVDKAVSQHAVIVFRVHCMYVDKIGDTGAWPVQTSSKLFAKLVDYCVKKGCTFVTMDGLMKLYS